MEGDELRHFVTEIVMQHLQAVPRAFEGVILQGTYDLRYGTVSLIRADTAALPTDDSSSPLSYKDVVLLTPVHLQQGGPVGGERVIAFPFHGGWACHFLHEEEDSPGAPAGEHWIGHSSGSSIKLTNAGNIDQNAHAAHTIEAATINHTATGSTTVHGASATLSSSGSTTVSGTNTTVTGTNTTVTGTAVSVTGGAVQIGPSGGPYLNFGGSGYGSGYALVRVTDLSALLSWLASHVHGNGNGGSPTTNPTTSPPSVTGSSEFTLGS